MNEHALWADLEEVVEVQEAALVGASSIKPELRRRIDWSFSRLFPFFSFFFSPLLPRAHARRRNVGASSLRSAISGTRETLPESIGQLRGVSSIRNLWLFSSGLHKRERRAILSPVIEVLNGRKVERMKRNC